MTRDELLAAWRARVYDTEAPFLWSDDEGIEYLRDAQNEAAERSLLLRDATTPAVCALPVVAGTATYPLHASVLEVLRAKLDSQRQPLLLSSTAEMDASAVQRASPGDGRVVGDSSYWGLTWTSDWESMQGVPRYALIDPQGGGWALRLVPAPTVNDTLRMVVHRLPLGALTAGSDSPEISTHLHIRLVDWMEYRAYLKKDSDTYDEKKSACCAAAFTTAFGPRKDADTRRTQRDRAPNVIAFREF